MAKKKVFDKDAHIKAKLESDHKQMKEDIAYGIVPLNPTRQFVIGERVHFGALNESYIREIFENGLYYKIECINVIRNRDMDAENEFHLVVWHELFKYNGTKPTNFYIEEKYRIVLSNSGIDSLLNRVYSAGVDFDVEYQREHVWGIDDKIALIDSIFNNIDIGKFVFIQRDFSVRAKLYEILDGKQRLTTICEFVEDRFKYKGFYYSELSNKDKNKFKNHGITWGYLENPNKKAIFESFIKLNTCGKPMASKHIDKVKKMLNELE
jgi:hypothetical protein